MRGLTSKSEGTLFLLQRNRLLFELFLVIVSAGVSVAAHAATQDHQAPLIREDFSAGLENWVWTGPLDSRIEVAGGAVLLDPLEGKHRAPGTEGINLWYREPLEGDVAIEFDLEPIQPGPSDGVSCNLLFMIDYRYNNREYDFIENIASETGHDPLLHGLPNRVRAIEEAMDMKYHPKTGYTITYYRINPREDPPYRMVVRRNPGFHLVHQEDQTEEDQWNYRHTVRIERSGRVLRFYQNDELALQATDTSDEPLPPRGHFGIRAWKAKVKLYGVRVYRLESSSASKTDQRQEQDR